MTPLRPPVPSRLRDRIRGCLLGGAVGDALGAPVEFLSLAEIRDQFGDRGILELHAAYGRLGAITDDTQMTLFTAEGLLRSMVRAKERGIGGAEASLVKDAYLRWLKTQMAPLPSAYRARHDGQEPGWLVGHRELFARRAPGTTCINALLHTAYGETRATNQSKGCGGVMRVAPAALFARVAGPEDPGERLATAFELGSELAAITHGHPTGQLASGALVAILLGCLQGLRLLDAVDAALAELRRHEHFEETEHALVKAIELARSEAEPAHAIRQLGEGWIAEEALAIGLYCALAGRDFESGVRLAVNIDGDSDSTGAIAGNILGAMNGEADIPRRWLAPLELREVITEIADDFLLLPESRIADYGHGEEHAYWWTRYPGF